MTLHPIPLNFLIYEENLIFFFISALTTCGPKKASSHSAVFTRNIHNRDREKSSGQIHLDNIWTSRAMDRTSALPPKSSWAYCAVFQLNLRWTWVCCAVVLWKIPASVLSLPLSILSPFSSMYRNTDHWLLLVRRKLPLAQWFSLEMHVIGTERRAQVIPTC